MQLDPSLTVDDASALAARVREAVEGLPDVVRAEVHLDLTGKGTTVGSLRLNLHLNI